jgi:hypothetical protein
MKCERGTTETKEQKQLQPQAYNDSKRDIRGVETPKHVGNA